ncbi:head-tail connector protein [Lactiplantibacillus plantarum]
MPIVDQDFYAYTYFGEQVPVIINFGRLEMRAEEMVNQYANYYFDSHNLDDLPLEADRINVKKAVCAQIEWFIDSGGVEELANAKQSAKGISHVTIGKFSYEKSAPTTLPRGTAQRSNAAINYLRPTGLLYRGVH